MNKQLEEGKHPYSPTAPVQREYLQALHERIEKLEAENQKFKAALEFYANTCNWGAPKTPFLELVVMTEDDLEKMEISGGYYKVCGKLARETLKGES